jgi:ribonuclease-3 family protein
MNEPTVTKSEAAAVSAASLAYLGDAVLEVLVRCRIVAAGMEHPSETSLRYVTAAAQSDALERILPLLTEEEEAAFRRGRNCVHGNVPKKATQAQYRRATGFEALFGYLYVKGETERIRELFVLAFSEDALSEGEENKE